MPALCTLDTCRERASDSLLVRRTGVFPVLLLAACGLSLRAQQPAPSPAPSPAPANTTPTTSSPPQDAQPPLTPEQKFERQIKQVDPLERGDDKDKKSGDDTSRGAQNEPQQTDTPTPGSIAAGERESARRTGPQVVEDGSSDEPVQEYSGPAVLSRSYSVNRPLIPQELRWSESVGLSAVYDTGAAAAISANGTATTADLKGLTATWSFSGRHYFRRDQIAASYSGSYSQYPGVGGFTGANDTATLDYSHVVTRRLTLNIVGSGSILSQNYTLNNEYLGPETTIANISLSSSPNIQITDYGIKQFSTQVDAVWQKSARLSFDAGGSFFAIGRNAPGLLGMTGEQAREDASYRLTRKTTVGAYYSFSTYRFPKSFGNSQTNTFGGIFSYAFSRSMQLRLRAGISTIDSLGLQSVAIPPVIAALLGQGSGMIDVSSKTTTSDISGQFIKDFRRGKTASVSFAHGVSPGNGLFQTSIQESIGASFAMPLFRRYSIQAAFGRDTLTAVTQAFGGYRSDYGLLSISHRITPRINSTVSTTLRHFELAQIAGLRNQVLFSAGVNWSSTNGRLWPF